MTDKPPHSADAEPAREAAPAKAKIVLPKLAPRHAEPQMGKGRGASFFRGNGGHAQTHNNKPPRLPGRNG